MDFANLYYNLTLDFNRKDQVIAIGISSIVIY